MADEGPCNINFLIPYGHIITYTIAKFVTNERAFQSNSSPLTEYERQKTIVANNVRFKNLCKHFALRFNNNTVFAFKPCRIKDS